MEIKKKIVFLLDRNLNFRKLDRVGLIAHNTPILIMQHIFSQKDITLNKSKH